MSLLLNTLRDHTEQPHQALHEHPRLVHLTSHSVTHDYYQDALSGFYGFYQPLEQSFQAVDDTALADFKNDTIIARLTQDLVKQNIDINSVPLRAVSADTMTPAQAIGYLYLREGSALGGQVISKKLEQHLDLTPGHDNTYFYGRGPDTGARWKRFTGHLTAVEDTIDATEAAAYARFLFQELHAWLLKGPSDVA